MAFRIIHLLSFPKGDSLNDDINGALCSVSYATFEDAISKIRSFSPGALLTKADVKSAFRLLPIFPSAFHSLGFYFDDCYLFDKCLSVSLWDVRCPVPILRSFPSFFIGLFVFNLVQIV